MHIIYLKLIPEKGNKNKATQMYLTKPTLSQPFTILK